MGTGSAESGPGEKRYCEGLSREQLSQGSMPRNARPKRGGKEVLCSEVPHAGALPEEAVTHSLQMRFSSYAKTAGNRPFSLVLFPPGKVRGKTLILGPQGYEAITSEPV